MKQSSTILTFLLFITVQLSMAQNLVVNGDLESWTGTDPDGWHKFENIEQESTTIHGGMYAAKHTPDESSKDLQQDIVGIEGGVEYTISYWYYDNDPEARTRIWSYWMDGTTYLDDHAEFLRPGEYSEDNANWQQFEVTLTAPAEANAFRFEVRVYKQDDQWDGAVYYDDFLLEGDVTIDPEPTNYPTNFTATANGLSADVLWEDATGAQLPDKYLVLASTSAVTVPEDGTPVADDMDFSDGEGAINVPYGVENATFANLDGNTTYYFAIYPYTNYGPNIDYKNDGTAPADEVTTDDVTVIVFEDFNDDWGDFTAHSVTGSQEWERINQYGLEDSPCMKMSGYEGGNNANEDWLFTPPINLDEYNEVTLSFYTAMNYEGNDLEVKISNNYSGSGDPGNADWTDLTVTLSPGNWEWTYSGDIDLSGMLGSEAYVGFKYTSTNSASADWEVDNVRVTGSAGGTIYPEPDNYPTEFAAIAVGTNIDLTWMDAAGGQLPSKYLIYAGTSSTLPVPVDGNPVNNDADLSDGEGAMNVSYGAQAYTFSGLDSEVTYYFTIYPYTNSGSNIDYKNDGQAPAANATTANVQMVTIVEQDFNSGWGEWQQISVTGSQEWILTEYFGINDTPCAKMTGYDGSASNENEDWLISPAMDLSSTFNEVLTFHTAMNYSGPELEIKISNDYDGSDPSTATWNDLSASLSSGDWTWTESGDIDISMYDGTAVYVAFVYYSTSSASATWEVDDFKVIGGSTGVTAPDALSVTLYPNPATDVIYLDHKESVNLDYQITSITGKAVKQGSIENGNKTIRVEELTPGIYFVGLRTEGSEHVSYHKVMIK